MHASSSNNSMGDNVWQGYVSAVACLLLSLLLLMSVLALAMVALSSQKVEAAAPTPDEQAAPEPTADAAAVIPPAPVVPTAQLGAQWALRFPADTVEIRTQDYASLAKRLAITDDNPGSQSRWTLWCVANGDSQSSQRLAFLRLMSVRELLVKQGASPKAIHIEIRPAGVAYAAADESLVLVARTNTARLKTRGLSNVSP